ncbi:MAG: hypothetical protein MI863_14005 [Desulfobacterales bacterium]|nr:hypothetical protein [Desulfobacterales bacterium]
MFSKLGILSLLIGFFVGVFSMISKFMNAENFWAGITLSSLSEDLSESLVDAISNVTLHNAVYTLLYEVPLGGVFIGLGVIFFIIALFVKEQ